MGWNFNQGQGANMLIPPNANRLGEWVAATQTPKEAAAKHLFTL